MSWLFSRALVEAFSEANCSDGAPFVPSSGSPTPQAYLPPDRMTAFSRPSRFGMTFSPLTDDLGAAVLTWCQEAFRARTSASQAREPASTEPAAACGDTWRGSLARFDPVTSSWKTAQRSLLEDSDESSVTWPRSGMTAGGLCWELPTLERRISGTGSGLWPTPQTRGFTNDGDLMALGRMCDSYEEMSRMAYRAADKKKQQYWPTPTCPNGGRSVAHVTDWRSERTAYNAAGKKVQVDLGQAVKRWPTPTVCGNYNRKGLSDKSGDGLATAVYQTPVARMWKDNGMNPSELERNSPTLAMQAGGSLNPTWVEWLMGWPLGWTDLKPLETDKSHCALQQRGDC
jgi:hypothetical protein